MRDIINLVDADSLLTEGRVDGVALIYHSTHADAARDILRQRVIQPNTTATVNGKSVQGVSLTRSRWFASAYLPFIFGFDAVKMKQRYGRALRPFADPLLALDTEFHADHRREAEEFLMRSLPLDELLVALWVSMRSSELPTRRDIMMISFDPLFRGVLD